MRLERRDEFAGAGDAVRPICPDGEGVPGPELLAESAASIAAAQTPSGAIPWEITGDTAGRIDAWDHVECAMALTTYGPRDAAERAFGWLATEQRPDGTWPREWLADMSGLASRSGIRLGTAARTVCRHRSALRVRARPRVADTATDANMTAYVAVGVWHHWLTCRDRGFAEAMWPTVRRALDAVCGLALPFGGIAWAHTSGGPARTALVAGSASMHHALRCGVRLAWLLGFERARWQAVAEGVADALLHREHRFEPKQRFAMDWYYPVLGGALRGEGGARRLAQRWADFVVPGVGVRCVDDNPWVTGAESCELALAALAVGLRQQAAAIVADMQHLRAPDGSYHTGYVFTDGKRWPIERSTWTAAAVVLAADALADTPRGGNVFDLP